MNICIARTQTSRDLCTGLAIAALLTAAIQPASAQVAPSLGAAQSFAVLAGTTVTNTGSTVVTGNLGVSPGTSITGFGPGIVVGGTIDDNNSAAALAQLDNASAYGKLASQECGTTYSGGTDLTGLTLPPGVYCFTSSGQLTGALTLAAGAQGSAAVWVFRVASSFTTGAASHVVVTGGGQNCNVFWQIGSSATLGGGTFVGNILALTSITLDTGATLFGSALAYNGAVTMESNTVSVAGCGTSPIVPIPPTLSKAFSPATIDAGGSSLLTIILSNADNADATLTSALTDDLPSGLVISGSARTTCVGGTAAASGSAVTLTGGSIPANGACDLTVELTAAHAGSYINSLSANALSTNNGKNTAPAVATLTVNALGAVAPTLGKAFGPATINAGGGSTVVITLSNPGPTAAALSAPLTDVLPKGVTISATPAPNTTCAGGTVSAPVNTSTLTLTGGTIPADGSCKVTVGVTAPTGGSFVNTLPANALMTSNGSNAGQAIATLTVNTPEEVAPTLGKAFTPATISPGGSSTLTITLSNSGVTPSVLSAPLVDTMPTGVTIAAAPSHSTTCSGGTVTAATGGSTVTLTGGTIPVAGSCTVTVGVTAPKGGSFINTLLAGALQTNNGKNAAPAVATLTVSSPASVTLGKAFSPATVLAGAVSTLTITLINAGAAATITAPLTDKLPSGMAVSGEASTTCSGGVATVGSGTVTLTGGSIPANGSCALEVNVVAAAAGSYFNTLLAAALQTSNGNNAGAAVATLTVNTPTKIPLTLGKSFSPASITAGEDSTLTITLTNPNNTDATLTAPLTDYLPVGLVVAGPGSTNSGGTYSGNTGSTTVTLTGGSIPANSSRTITVTVSAAAGGSYINTLPAGALQTNLGSNTAPAFATLTASVAPTLSKSFSPSSIKPGGTSILTITLSNANSTAAALTAPLTDTLPNGILVNGAATTTCGGTVVAALGGSSVALTGGSIPAKSSCTVMVNVTVNASYINTLPAGALQTTAGKNAAGAVATLIVQ
jgi:uncharacterized repeat protein (TIGR01451 family)